MSKRMTSAGGRSTSVLYRHPVALGDSHEGLVLRVEAFRYTNTARTPGAKRKETQLHYDGPEEAVQFDKVLCTGKMTHLRGVMWEIDGGFKEKAQEALDKAST